MSEVDKLNQILRHATSNTQSMEQLISKVDEFDKYVTIMNIKSEKKSILLGRDEISTLFISEKDNKKETYHKQTFSLF